MSKLVPVTWNELVRRLHQIGFNGPYIGGKHPYMVKNDLVLTIPNPHKKEIGVDLLSRILKQGEIKREEWLKTK